MATIVSLRQVVDELDILTDESSVYLNRQTGELYTLPDEVAGMVEDDADPEDLAEWLGDEVPKVREILESEDWLALPTRFDIHEWAIMDDFARSIDDPELQDELLGAIRGRGAFRYFKDTIHRREIQQDWYDFKTAALAQIAADWLDGHGISYTRDAGASPAG
ncbi:MAG: UPF0158 family protein [Coriobacteriia bacterium]|nr:UPF0158 family protein [Coriobacteriia bacterium]